MRADFYINDGLINKPNNADGLEIERNFDSDASKSAVSLSEVEFGVGDKSNSNDGAIAIQRHIDGGNSNDVGVFEGLPMHILLDDQKGNRYKIVDGYIDTSKSEIRCGRIKAPFVQKDGIDSLEEKLRGLSPAYLESIGKIGPGDYISCPYVIEKKQNALDIITAIVTIFVVTDKFKEQVTHIQSSIGRLASPFSVSEILALIARIIYMIALFITLIQLIKDLVNALVQPVKYHSVMRVVDTIKVCLSHLGYGFSSTILEGGNYNQAVILAEKYNLKEDNTGDGILQAIPGFFKPDVNEQVGYYKHNFEKLLVGLKEDFNAKIVVVNGVVFFEKKDFVVKAPVFRVPPHEFWEDHKFNWQDIVSNYIFSYQTDLGDQHTIQEYKGTSVSVQTHPKNVRNTQFVLNYGLKDIKSQFALAKTKKELNFLEELILAFLDAISIVLNLLYSVINAVIRVINTLVRTINKIIKFLKKVGIRIKNPIKPIPELAKVDFGQLIEDRIGMLKMERDFVDVNKIFILPDNSNPRENKPPALNEAVFNARFIYENFHYFESPIPQNGWHGNQYKIRRFKDIPFCFNDDYNVRDNNNIFDVDGRVSTLETLKFNPYKQSAEGEYKVPYIYTTNFTETIIEDDGS